MADAALDPSLQLIKALARAPLCVALYDCEDILRYANEAYERSFLRGLPLPQSFAAVLRHGFENGFGVQINSGDIDAFLADILPRRGLADYRAIEVDTVEGQWLLMTETRLENGWMLCVGSDITHLKHNERTLRHARDEADRAANTDALTGCANRRRISELGDALVEAHGRSGVPLSLAIVDLDHFKRINDLHGHEAGDAVLRHFAAYVMAQLRTGDVLGRIGGEEFVLLLPSANEGRALLVIERLLGSLPAAVQDDATIPLAFSAGVAQVQPQETFATCMRRADQALYRAKALGRGRACAASAMAQNAVSGDAACADGKPG